MTRDAALTYRHEKRSTGTATDRVEDEQWRSGKGKRGRDGPPAS